MWTRYTAASCPACLGKALDVPQTVHLGKTVRKAVIVWL